MSSGVGVAFAIFRKVFPAKDLSSTSPSEIAELGKVYAKWQWIALPFVFGYTIATGYGWFLLLRSLARVASRLHEPSVHILVLGPEFWAIPSLFLGIITSAVPTLFTMKAMLGDRYDEYTRWTNLHHGFDGMKAFVPVAILIVGGSALMIAGGLSTWVAFRDDEVILKRSWPWRSTSYPYDRVRSVSRIDRFRGGNGNLEARPYFAMRFDDGETWTSRELIKNNSDEPYGEIFAFVSARSRRPIQELDLIDELKP